MADAKHEHDVSQSEIAVHWREEEIIPPPESFKRQANLTDPAVFDRFSEEHFPECFEEFAEMLDWYRRWDRVIDGTPPFWNWFVGGELNACYNCVDRHLPERRDRVALHFVPEPEDEAKVPVTYGELYERVNAVAALLREVGGLKRGDRVTLHLPMTVDLPVTMLACARLGVIHSQVFSGFSGKACADRIVDSESRVLITADAYWRGGKLLDHKEKADIAVAEAAAEGQQVDTVLIWQRYPGKNSSPTAMVDGRDIAINEQLPRFAGRKVEPERMRSEDPLFLMYTSGTTGKPKGAQHSTGGYLAYVTATSKWFQDIHPDDVYWCMADIGWITGHSYIVYGPLALGTCSVIYEGTPTHPDAGRPWRIAKELGVSIFHTSPTAIRALRRVGPDEPAKYDYHFKHMTTVGEPIEPEVWRWYYNVVGKGEAVVVDTWWQTETGGFLCTTVPALQGMKAGSAGPGVPGIYPVIFDEEGQELPPGKAGNICIRNPWPGRMQTIWGDHDRFVRQYYARYNADRTSTDWRDWPYFAGDGAVLAPDGYYRILGRIDDVINVAGHRLGTKELESAALTVSEVSEAAVVPVADPIKGTTPHIFVALKPGLEPSRELEQKVVKALADQIGPIAKPGRVWIVPDMPKTRSGKIMRRVLAAIASGQSEGDITTLANPEVVEAIKLMRG